MPLPRRLPAIPIARRCLFNTPHAPRRTLSTSALPITNTSFNDLTEEILQRNADSLKKVENFLNEIEARSGTSAAKPANADTYAPAANLQESRLPSTLLSLPDTWHLEKLARKSALHRVKRKDEGIHHIEGYIKDLEFLLKRIEVALYPLLDFAGKSKVMHRHVDAVGTAQRSMKKLVSRNPLEVAAGMGALEENMRKVSLSVDHMLDTIRHNRQIPFSPVAPMSLEENMAYWEESVESRLRLLRNDSYPGGKVRVVADTSYRVGCVLEGVQEGLRQVENDRVGSKALKWRESVLENTCALLEQHRGAVPTFIASVDKGVRPKFMYKYEAMRAVSEMLVEASSKPAVDGAWKPTRTEVVAVMNTFEQLQVEFSSPTAKWYMSYEEEPMVISRLAALKQLQEMVEVGLDRKSKLLPSLETALKNLSAVRNPQKALDWLNENPEDPEVWVSRYGYTKPVKMPRVEAIDNLVRQLRKEVMGVAWQIRALHATVKDRNYRENWQPRQLKTFGILFAREDMGRMGGQHMRAFSTARTLRKGVDEFNINSKIGVSDIKGSKGNRAVRAFVEGLEKKYLTSLNTETVLDLNPQSLGGLQEVPDVSPEDAEYSDELVTSVGADHTEMVNFKGFKPLNPGDLCELRQANGAIEMGIYLRPSQDGSLLTSDFLTPLGKINRYFPARVAFSVNNFTPVEAVDVILEYQKRLEQFKSKTGATICTDVISQKLTGPVLNPIRKFHDQSIALYTAHIDAFQRLHGALADELETRTVKLSVATEMVFGKKHGDAELYATHMALMGDGMRFMGDRGFHRYTQTFRVRSKRDFRDISRATQLLRKADFGGAKKLKDSENELIAFIEKAKELIKIGEEVRAIEGTVKPVERPDLAWTKADKKFIGYLQTRLRAYGLQQTPMEGLCPLILRLIGGKYTEDPDVMLDPAMMHDFLVDIGVYSPWQNVLTYDYNMRVPGYLPNKLLEQEEQVYAELSAQKFEDLGLKDKFEGQRKDWGDMPVYAIDDPEAKEIDDGISFEVINENETWYHVHVAHPSAFFEPDHQIMQIARNRGSTKYLDPYSVPMLPHVVTEALGIRENGPALTISSRVDNEGNVLEYKVTPSILRNVKRFTYDQVDEILGTTKVPTRVFQVGDFPVKDTTKQNPISAEDAANVKILRERAELITLRRVRDGMVNPNAGSEHISIHDPNLVNEGKPAPHPIFYTSYPSIRISVFEEEKSENVHLSARDVVAECMILANSSVALYSGKNNIPMPFRVLEYHPGRPEAVEYFVKEILPKRSRLGQARGTFESLKPFMMVGMASVRPDPGPQMTMGLPHGYVRCTSPLRRFTDMIAHWNLESTILSSSPPITFPADALAAQLPPIDIAEKMANYGSYKTAMMWKAALVKRVLDNKIEGVLPKRMHMLLTEVPEFPQENAGYVAELATHAKMTFPSVKSIAGLPKETWVWVEPVDVRMAERGIKFEFRGVVSKKELKEYLRNKKAGLVEDSDPDVVEISVHSEKSTAEDIVKQAVLEHDKEVEVEVVDVHQEQAVPDEEVVLEVDPELLEKMDETMEEDRKVEEGIEEMLEQDKKIDVQEVDVHQVNEKKE